MGILDNWQAAEKIKQEQEALEQSVKTMKVSVRVNKQMPRSRIDTPADFPIPQ